jgi:hypothetical protein
VKQGSVHEVFESPEFARIFSTGNIREKGEKYGSGQPQNRGGGADD